jgi:hypothetical protein
MALRNQPYFPLYVQDYLTDEKLNMCSWSTQGIYIKILCILHKQSSYGSILFKQNYKQNESTINYFASILIKNLPCQFENMVEALGELIDNEVLIIDDLGLHQKRMVKDGQISDERSKAAKKGGGNPNLFKQNSKQTDKQNTEYEYEVENIINKDKKVLEQKLKKYQEHLLKQTVRDRLGMNLCIKPDAIKQVIVEFIETCYGEIVLKPNEFAVETYFIHWVKAKPNRVQESIENQAKKRHHEQQLQK